MSAGYPAIPTARWPNTRLLVRTDLQGHGLGWALLRQIIDYAEAEGIGRIEGIVLTENDRMLDDVPRIRVLRESTIQTCRVW